MPRPPALPADNIVDAEVCARAGSTIARHFSAADLPRVNEAGGREGSSIEANFQFAHFAGSHFEGRPTVSGELHGAVVLTCQRCMQPVPIEVDDSFQVLIVEEERSDEPGGYEPVVANASRLDLRWLAEEQVLLALPLVPMHENTDCAKNVVASSSAADVPDSEEPAEEEVRQQPFRNLRDLMRKQ